MERTTDIAALAAALARVPGLAGVQPRDLAPLGAKGVSHDHWRIARRRLVARVARFHQWGLAPEAALAYEAAAFERAAASGHTPRLVATIPAGAALPTGALVVVEIAGRPPRLPGELPAIAQALASLHGLAVPPPAGRPPLLVQDDAFADTLAVIEAQAASLPQADLARTSLSAIGEELEWARAEARRSGRPRQPLVLAGTDTHPGNFLVDGAGHAWFVDLEKALYGAAAIDLAHATLATSTGWDPDCAAMLSGGDVRHFHRAYFELAGARRAAEVLPALAPFRRLTWLRTITWFARWRAEWAESRPIAGAHAAHHVSAHVDACLAPGAIARQRREWLGPAPMDLI